MTEKEIFQSLLEAQMQMQNNIYPQIRVLSQEQQMLVNTRAMMHEVIEVENELNWKHWKAVVAVDDDKIKEEIVDEFIFLMNQINISGMDSEELFDRTLKKMNTNVNRQLTGY